jgi:glycine dehydrogenase subunit 1
MSFISHSLEDQQKMLEAIGVSSLDDLFKDIPAKVRIKDKLEIPTALSEIELTTKIEDLAFSQDKLVSFLGAGLYEHYIPAIVDDLSSRSEFYTAYTPYQPEVSQGTLTAIFEFQSLICKLTGMDLTNASMYDGATSLAEAVLMSTRSNKKKKILVSKAVHPNYRQVLKTYTWAAELDLQEVEIELGETSCQNLEYQLDDQVSCVVVQSPNFLGIIEDLKKIATILATKQVNFILTVTEPLSLALLKKPADCGVDITCGELQSFGNSLSFGGPLLGFIAAKEKFIRLMPGRLVGQTVDAAGDEAYALTLQTREQHIRRERATSNICSNEGLLALRTVIYLSYFGNKLKDLALLNHKLANYLKSKFSQAGFQLAFPKPFFNEFGLKVKGARDFLTKLEIEGFKGGYYLGDLYPDLTETILICVTEKHSPQVIDDFFAFWEKNR